MNYYQPYYPQQDERIWVQNEQGAEAYLVAPNGFVRLWDANKPVFYEKRADASGRPLPIDAYTYSKTHLKAEIETSVSEAYKNMSEEIENLKTEIRAIREQIRPKKGAKDEKPNADDK